MPTPADKKKYYQTISRSCYAANLFYEILSIFYLVLFIIAKLNILIYIDAAMVIIFLLFFILIKKKNYFPYTLACGNTFFVFIIVTTIMLGFETGFHLYLIGFCVISFFSTYFTKKRDIRGSIIWVTLSLAIYLTLYFVSQFVSPYYVAEGWLERTLFATNAVIVFMLITTYLIVILKYAFSLEKKITNEARIDELTQINNRYSLYDYFSQQEDKSSLLLVIFDVDDFKNINDTYGHVAGDFILKEIARITTSILDDSFVCRYGGEEFVVVMENKGKKSSFAKLEKLRKIIENEDFYFEKNNIRITITLGASEYYNDQNLEQWIESADKKMYLGKSNGKNQTVL